MGNIAKGSVVYTPTSSDDVTVKVDFKGDINYKASTISKIIHARHRTTLTIIKPTSTVYTGDDYTLTFNLKDNESTLSGDYNLTVTVNGTEKTVKLTTNDNHVAVGTLIVNAGTSMNTIKAVFSETDDYLGTSMTASITPELRLTTLTVTPSSSTPTVDDDVTFNVELKDTNNSLIDGASNYNVKVTGGASEVTTPLTISNHVGTCSVKQVFDTVGEYNVVFTFNDVNGVYKSTSTTVTINVQKINPTIQLKGNYTVTVGTEETLNITFTDPKQKLTTATLDIQTADNEGGQYTTLDTITLNGTNGVLTGEYKYTPTTSTIKVYKLLFNGDSKYSAKSSNTLTVTSQHTTNLAITSSTETPIVGEEMTFDIQLTDPENTLSGEQSVDVTINGTKQTLTLNTDDS